MFFDIPRMKELEKIKKTKEKTNLKTQEKVK